MPSLSPHFSVSVKQARRPYLTLMMSFSGIFTTNELPLPCFFLVKCVFGTWEETTARTAAPDMPTRRRTSKLFVGGGLQVVHVAAPAAPGLKLTEMEHSMQGLLPNVGTLEVLT